MVESPVEVLVKEEKRPEANMVAVPPPIFLHRRPTTSYLWVFNLRLCPSRNKIHGGIYVFLGQDGSVETKFASLGP
jgi:hypothetical protein